PTPNEPWQTRRPIAPQERRLFQENVLRHREGSNRSEDLSATKDRRMQREAIRRALVEHSILFISRGGILLPITRQHEANIRKGLHGQYGCVLRSSNTRAENKKVGSTDG